MAFRGVLIWYDRLEIKCGIRFSGVMKDRLVFQKFILQR